MFGGIVFHPQKVLDFGEAYLPHSKTKSNNLSGK
jgi:hypothetical protein